MKKVLSLVLSLALIIATMALPISASAASIDLLDKASGTITMAYSPSATEVHPGDSFTVDVKAVASVETLAVYDYVVNLSYDSTVFTVTNEESISLKKLTDGTTSYVSLIGAGGANLTNSAETTPTLATLNFTVKDDAAATIYTSSVIADDSSFTVVNGSAIDWYTKADNNLVDAGYSITVADNTYAVKVDGVALNDGMTYYDADGFTLAVTGTNIETVTVTNTSTDPATVITPSTSTEGTSYNYSITVAGAYTVAVKVKGKDAETKTFTLSTDTIAADLALDFTPADTGYKAGATVSVPVKISGLASAQAAMVSFALTYDPAKLELDTNSLGANVSYTDGTVVYGDKANSSGLATDATVATLKFTVKSEAAYGASNITIKDAKLALVKQAIDPTKDPIGISVGTKTIVIVPEKFATLPDNIGTEDWSKTAYNVVVTPTDSSTTNIKYVKLSKDATPAVGTQAELAAMYKNETAIDSDTVTVNTEEKYVIVAAIGTDPNLVYQHVGTLVPGASAWYDGTAPTVSDSGITVSGIKEAKNGYTLDISALTKSDALSGVNNLEYALVANGSSGDPVYVAIDSVDAKSVTIPAQNFSGVVKFRVTDKAGNTAESTGVALKLDADDPTITDMKVGDVKADGSKDITASVADEGSGVTGGTLSVTVYYSASTEGTALTEVSAIEALANGVAATVAEGKATYNTKVAGRYYMVVADAAGHKAAASVDATFDKIDAASGIKVALYNGATPAAGFKKSDATELTAYSGSNGSFRYVAITAEAAPTGYTNTMTLSKEGETAAAYTAGTAITDIGTYVLTITTAHNTDTTDKASATYKFSIVEETNMPSPNNDKRFNIIDYSMVRQVVGNSETAVLPTADNKFTGGLFSGDVNGNLGLDSNDVAELIRSIRAGEKPGTYTFKVFNKATTGTQE